MPAKHHNTKAASAKSISAGSCRQSKCHLLRFVICKRIGYFGSSDYQKEAEENCAEEEKEVAESYSC